MTREEILHLRKGDWVIAASLNWQNLPIPKIQRLGFEPWEIDLSFLPYYYPATDAGVEAWAKDYREAVYKCVFTVVSLESETKSDLRLRVAAIQKANSEKR